MSAKYSATAFLALATAVALTAAPVPEPSSSGELLFPGRMVFGLSGLPGGELVAPCEDQSVSVLDAQARVLTAWQARARIAATVTIAPRGPLQLLSVPQITGRVDILAWDALTVHLAVQFSLQRAEVPSGPTVWDASGRLYQGWMDGHLESWNAHGQLLWSRDLAPFRGLLNDDSQGLFVAASGSLLLLDRQGNTLRQWPLDAAPRGLIQTLAGNLYLWSETGLWLLDPEMAALRRIYSAPGILGVTSDRQNRLVVTEPARVRRLGPGGSVVVQFSLPHPALAEAVVDDRGRVHVPTSSGLEQWSYDGHFLGTLGSGIPTTAPVLTEAGLLAWGTEDWRVQVWKGGRFAPFSWSQAGGGPARASSTTRPATLVARASNWEDQPDFGYFLQLASSGEDEKQQTVLRLFEAKEATATLLTTWPFANLILLKIVRSGITDLELHNNYVTNNWPGNRLRAYRLLALTAGAEDREELLSLLDREFDPVNLAQGARAMAATGWDGDGRLMKMLTALQQRKPGEAVLADALLDSARQLWVAGGNSADPSMVILLTALYQADLPRNIRQKAQTFFQDLMDAPQ
ncbi:MAG: hypothetical protein WCG80_00670 [Spirochaetales bacterium]